MRPHRQNLPSPPCPPRSRRRRSRTFSTVSRVQGRKPRPRFKLRLRAPLNRLRAMRSLSDVLYNFHWIVPGEAARSAQAYAGFLGPFLSAHGIRSIVNLRGRNDTHLWWRYETRVSARRAIAHFDTMLNSRRLPTGQMLLDVLSAFDA